MNDRSAAPDHVSSAPPTPQADAGTGRLALNLLLVAVFVVFLNETVMNVAVPRIMYDFGVTASAGQWLTSGFALTLAVVIPTTGFLLQRLRTRTAFVLGMSTFTLGTVLAASAPASIFGLLIAGRVVQACGTAIMMPLLFTTVLNVIPAQDRGRYMGRISIVLSVAPAIGPAISGLTLQLLDSWRWLFILVAPIALGALVLGAVRLPNVSEPEDAPIDAASVVLSALGFSGLVFGLSELGTSFEGSPLLPWWPPLGLGVLSLGVFVWRQLRLQARNRALLDLRAFDSSSFRDSTVLMGVMMLSLFGAVILLPIYLKRVADVGELEIGILLLPGGLLMGLLGPPIGRLYDRFGARPLVLPGTLAVSGAFWGMQSLGVDSPAIMVLVFHVLLSLGLAFVFTPTFALATVELPRHLYSHGSAIISTVQQVAGAAGTALFIAGLALGIRLGGGVDSTTATPGELADGVHLAFLIGAVLSLGPVIVAARLRRPLPTSTAAVAN